ncbi:MAG TPA: tRNA (adenosine(37)-N6)-threonylcarbamoyltransferase complex transferase subunit TsaD [Halothiobacillaceae bacterium]|nr:tRNA (adenosine(37)-N6)-threonylcarbamoyltransferase complex transferase subunit TsaD [Halothiobacillaceae bacterium]
MYVLGFESSCDETAVALYGGSGKPRLLSHRVHSQTEIHQDFGGVVPELAARDHMRRLPLLTRMVLDEAGLQPDDLSAVAYTAGPGLAGALMAGCAFARGFAQASGLASVAINHLEGHLLAPLLDDPAPQMPYLALLVSGGHTQIIRVEALGSYQLLGESIDDAIGEAFDKSAKLMGLGYPGGAALSELAQSGRRDAIAFARPMTDRPGLDFSFSGLKTAVANAVRDGANHADVAASFEQAVVDTLKIKLRRAVAQTGLKRLVVAGGVAANQPIRAALTDLMKSQDGMAYFPPLSLCTDNAAMIALAGFMRFEQGQVDRIGGFKPRPRWPLSDLTPPAAQI